MIEVGIRDKMPVENVSALIVPKDKVSIVKAMCGNKNIHVLGFGDNSIPNVDRYISSVLQDF